MPRIYKLLRRIFLTTLSLGSASVLYMLAARALLLRRTEDPCFRDWDYRCDDASFGNTAFDHFLDDSSLIVVWIGSGLLYIAFLSGLVFLLAWILLFLTDRVKKKKPKDK